MSASINNCRAATVHFIGVFRSIRSATFMSSPMKYDSYFAWKLKVRSSKRFDDKTNGRLKWWKFIAIYRLHHNLLTCAASSDGTTDLDARRRAPQKTSQLMRYQGKHRLNQSILSINKCLIIQTICDSTNLTKIFSSFSDWFVKTEIASFWITSTTIHKLQVS